MLRLRGRTGRIQLRRGQHAVLEAPAQVVGGGAVAQVDRHQRHEVGARRQGRHDPLAVSPRERGGRHGGLEVRHDDGAAELRGAVGQHRLQHGAVAQMQVPVVGAAQGDTVGHGKAHFNRAKAASIAPTPSMKSSMSIASFGLCEPFWFRTNNMPLGMPALANSEASCPAPLGMSSKAAYCAAQASDSTLQRPSSMVAGSLSRRRSNSKRTPRSRSIEPHSARISW